MTVIFLDRLKDKFLDRSLNFLLKNGILFSLFPHEIFDVILSRSITYIFQMCTLSILVYRVHVC